MLTNLNLNLKNKIKYMNILDFKKKKHNVQNDVIEAQYVERCQRTFFPKDKTLLWGKGIGNNSQVIYISSAYFYLYFLKSLQIICDRCIIGESRQLSQHLSSNSCLRPLLCLSVRHQILSAQEIRFASHVLLVQDKVPSRTLQRCGVSE